MGRVCAGTTPEGDAVAVKTLLTAHLERDDLRARFDREVAAMRMVQGPGVAALLAASPPDADPPWLAMERMPGLSLRDHVKQHGPLDERSGAALGLVLAGALTDIHTAELLHRDLKPANVLLGPEGPRFIDFGLVAIGGAGGDLTATGMWLGTPVCMAPEQVTSPREVTVSADLETLLRTL